MSLSRYTPSFLDVDVGAGEGCARAGAGAGAGAGAAGAGVVGGLDVLGVLFVLDEDARSIKNTPVVCACSMSPVAFHQAFRACC